MIGDIIVLENSAPYGGLLSSSCGGLKGPSGPKGESGGQTDGRTDRQTDGRTDTRTDNGFKGGRCCLKKAITWLNEIFKVILCVSNKILVGQTDITFTRHITSLNRNHTKILN